MELWDIYDENKQPTGRTMVRNDWNMKPGDFHLTVLGCIKTPDGRFLITKRAEDKAWAPGQWEISGGGVQAGESSFQAVCREVQEETGLDVSKASGGLIFTYQRINPEEKDNYFVDVYCFERDIDPEEVHLQLRETKQWQLATAEEIADLGAKGMFLHYNSICQIFA